MLPGDLQLVRVHARRPPPPLIVINSGKPLEHKPYTLDPEPVRCQGTYSW